MVTAAMNANPTDEADASDTPQDPQYFYKPNLLGSPWEFALRPQGLEWQYGRRSGLIRYSEVQLVRMSYRPASLQGYRFLTEIWSPGNPKIQIYSTSFRGLMEMARQDADYSAFVTELHRRLAGANSTAQFTGGTNPVIYWLGAAVFLALGLVLVGLLGRTLVQRDLLGAAVIGGALLLFLWQVIGIFSRNRPVTYRADAPPAILLPKKK